MNSEFSECSTIGIMQKNLKQYMRNSENPTGTNIINNMTALKFFQIAKAIKKNLCLASYSLYLFFERKELIEVPLNPKTSFNFTKLIKCYLY